MPHEYDGCKLSEDKCEANYDKLHEFNRSVAALGSVSVTCEACDTCDELPDWVWIFEGKTLEHINILLTQNLCIYYGLN